MQVVTQLLIVVALSGARRHWLHDGFWVRQKLPFESFTAGASVHGGAVQPVADAGGAVERAETSSAVATAASARAGMRMPGHFPPDGGSPFARGAHLRADRLIGVPPCERP